MYIIHNIFLKLGARYNMNVYVYKLGLSFKYWYLIYKIKICYYYYVLRFVLPKLRIAGSKKFSSEEKMRMSFAHEQPNSCNRQISDYQEWSPEAFLIKTKSESSRKQRTKKREMLFKSTYK